MKNSVNRNVFHTVSSSREFERSASKIYEWVPKCQIIATFIIIFQYMHFRVITEGLKAYLFNGKNQRCNVDVTLLFSVDSSNIG
jgi:hypothetical protein